MRTTFHLLPVFRVEALRHLLNRRGERHDLQSGQHRDKELSLPAQVFNGCYKVYGLSDIEVDHTHDHIVLVTRGVLLCSLPLGLVTVIH